MNRIYQVVWSKAKNCYTVVSEIAKRHGKGNRARTCAAAFLAALALTSVMGMSEAQAQTIDADGISNGDARIALNGAAGMVGMVNGKDASIFMYGGNTTINKKVTIDQTGKIIGVAAGAVTAGSTDAVNGGQLHAVAAEASKHSKVVNGSNINVEESEVNGQKIYKVGLNDDVRLGMIETTGSITTKDSISAANGAQLADINVSGNVISNGKAAIALYGDSGIAGMKNGKGASIYMQDGHTSINEKVNIDQNGKITGVAAGAVTAGSTDAVNGSQLHAVATEAGKHSKVVNGSNINVEESEVNGQKIYKVGLNDDVRLGTIETTGSIATKDRISADKGAQLADINVSGNIISNGAAKIALNDSLGMAAMVNGKGASIFMQDGNTVINRKVAIDKEGNITGTNAVNANVVNANTLNAKYNLNVGEMAENGYMPFFVDSNGAFHAAAKKFSVDKDGKVTATAGEIGNVVLQNGKVTATEGEIGGVTINKGMISNGEAKIALYGDSGIAGMMNGKGASIYMQDGNTVINRKVNIDKDGKVTATAGEIGNVVLQNGKVTAAAGEIGGVTIKEGNITGVNAINTSAINTNVLNSKYNLSVGTANENGTMPFFVNSTGDFYAANNKFSVGKDGKVTATAGEIGNVVLQNGKVTATEGEIGGVTINKGMISNGEAKIALYGDSGIAGMMNGKGASIYMQDGNTVINSKVAIDKDGKVTATAGEIGGVTINHGISYKNTSLRDGSLFVGDDQGNYSQISPEYAKLGKVTINKEGNITGANAIQTNALNAKYNLSVGTANENGTMPFFVNSTGDFYAANNKFSVGKDGKVTATAGEIGGVTINHGISYKNTSLRDGSLFVGDDQGNYSQISPEYAKLGKVTINKEGNITGANAIQTNALNAKYNLSVGTANENGTMPFFVNSTGDFYAANNKFSVGKDGKVTATAGEIGGVTINKGIFYKNTALRDGELFVGDASGNYSQITTKGAKLGKVTVAEDGKITGVAAGAVTAGSTDAVNGSQLHAVAAEAAKHSKVVNGSNIKVEEAEVNGQKIYKVGLNDDVLLGKLTGNNVSLSGTNGTIETTGYIATKDRIIADKGAQLAGINVSGNIISNGAAKIALYGDSGVAGMVNGKGASIYMQDGNTIINSKVAIDKDGKITGVAAGAVTAGSTDAVNGGQLHAVAADVAQNKADIAQNKADIAQNKADIAQNKADIAQNKADIAQNKADIAQNKTDIAQNKADIGKLDNRVTNVENLAKQHTTVEAGNNITVTESTNTDGGKKYTVGMAKDITVDSVKVGDKTYVSKDGLNANNQTITNVKDGKIEEGSKDAVNGGQLYATNQLVKDNASNISLLGNSINKLNNRVDKVGAGAAALAALHPLDFDPEDKWDFAAGYGNYSGASAVALSAYYRPNEDTMFSVGGSFGNGENMVNAGVSLKLGQSNRAPASKAAMEKKISALSQEVEELKAAIADLRAAQTKAKDATAKDAQKK